MSVHDIEARGLDKRFPGGVCALDGLDLRVPRGSFYGLLGRNGAGKTTALRILMGLLGAEGGEARVLGQEMSRAPAEHRARVAYVSQVPRLYGHLDLAAHARLLACFYPRFEVRVAEELARRFELPWRRRFPLLSAGNQRKAAVVLALAARPEVLILDEPAAGLDPLARNELIDVLVDLLSQRGTTSVLLSTHLVGDLERLAEHVGILDAGRMLREAPLETLKARLRRVQIVFDEAPPDGFALPGVLHQEQAGPVLRAVAEIPSEQELERLRRLEGARVDLFPLSLEEIFVELVGGRREPAPGSPFTEGERS
jgi:ABC-2 type transport system ATP-binding protein